MISNLIKKIDINKLPKQKLVIIVQALVIIAFFRGCQLQDLKITNAGVEANFYKQGNEKLITEKNQLGQELSSQKEAIINTNKELEKELLKTSKLSKIVNHLKAATNTSITNVLAPYIEMPLYADVYDSIALPIPKGKIKAITDSLYIPTGSKFALNDEFFTIDGTVTNKGVLINSLDIPDSITVNRGFKKTSGFLFFKKKEPFVELIHSNPYVRTINMENITLKEEKKWYQKGAVKFAAGAAAGVFMTTYLIRK